MYLEAYEARNFIFRMLVMGDQTLLDGSEVVLRTFITSSRSFKHSIAHNEKLPADFKKLIIKKLMPKFIFVAELSTKELFQQTPRLADGIIILDATEANLFDNKPLILSCYQGKFKHFDRNIGKFEKNNITLEPFPIFDTNLNNNKL